MHPKASSVNFPRYNSSIVPSHSSFHDFLLLFVTFLFPNLVKISLQVTQVIILLGYSHGQNSVANGSGLTASVAGQLSSFSVYLEDVYHNPSPVEAERFRVQVKRKFDSYNVRVTVLPTLIVDGKSCFALLFCKRFSIKKISTTCIT